MPEFSRETASKEILAVVIGTHHEFQRHQDTSADRERVRADFEKLLHKMIEVKKSRFVAEEAGDDKAVWESLKNEAQCTGSSRTSPLRRSPAWVIHFGHFHERFQGIVERWVEWVNVSFGANHAAMVDDQKIRRVVHFLAGRGIVVFH